MIIYGLKNCDTCRKARKALPDFEFHDVREHPLPDVVLDAALQAFGDRLMNTRSTTWRGLDEAARAGSPRALMCAYPALMKRPLIAVDNSFFLGWSVEVEAQIKALL